MTGNKNAWRAPLAGLASVAMLATMGVSASVASAAAPVDVATVLGALPSAPTVEFAWDTDAAGNGGTSGAKNFVSGDSLADAQTAVTNGFPVGRGARTSDGARFVGWSTSENGNAVDFAGTEVSSSVKLHAVYRANVTTLRFEGVDINTVNGDATPDVALYHVNADKTAVNVPAGSRIPQAYWPVDLPDGQVVKTWDGTITTKQTDGSTKTTEFENKTIGSLNITNATEVTLRPNTSKTGTVEATKTTYNDPASYASNGDAHLAGSLSDGTVDGNYVVDVESGKSLDPQISYALTKNFVASTDDLPQQVAQWKAADSTKTEYTATLSTEGSVLVAFQRADGTYTAQLVADNGHIDGKSVDANASSDQADKGWKVNNASKGTFVTGSGAEISTGSYVYDWDDATFQATTDTSGASKVADNFVVFEATVVPTNKFNVTFHYGDYKGAPDDVTAEYAPTDTLKAPEYQKREGYYFKGWFKDKTGGDPLDFTTILAGELTNGGDVTLYAHWARAAKDDALEALKYVPAINDSTVGTTDAQDHAKRFTSASWKAYTEVYKKALNEYKTANWGAYNDELDATTAKKIVDELQAGWKQLRFNNGDVDTTLDGTNNGVTGAEVVYRLSTPDGRHHFMTADENEVLARTNTFNGQGGWKLESSASFRMVGRNAVDAGNYDKGNVSADLGYQTDGGAGSVTLDLVKPVVRLYNPLLQEHLYTPALYDTKTPVVRFYSPVTNLHFYTADSNEIATWNQHPGVWNNEGNKFYAL